MVTAASPGDLSSRQVLSPFDIRATTTPLPAGVRPDELMFDWTGLPAGATASIYLPAVTADGILATAGAMYGAQPYTRIDAHTLGCQARGITFMPIPPGSGNYAGLLDVELPATVRPGDQFAVVVSQVTNALTGRDAGADATVPPGQGWRKIAGTFKLSVPVSTRAQILPAAERDLSILRWILQAIPPTDRWYPVMSRYLGALADRIQGLGGNPSAIPPSATGTWPGQPGGVPHHGPPHTGHEHLTGKVDGLIYDHFGDFEGFTVETGHGEVRTFYSRERRIEELAQRAWTDRTRVTVTFRRPDDHHPVRLVLHRG
jgi:hypothetical protein